MVEEGLRTKREMVVREHVAAENRGDFTAAIACMRRPRFELVANERVYDGTDELARYYRESRTAFPDLQAEVIELHHADDAVIVECWVEATHEGRLGGVAATGRRWRCRMAVVFAFDGADFVGKRVYFDQGTIARQLAAD